MAPRILFVDDEREIVSSFARYFKHRGLEPHGAYGVAEAVALLEAGAAGTGPTFDLVCTDLRMPDGDGLDVLRAVRRLFPNCPVLVLTAYGSVATSVEAMRRGALTMLEKPIPVADLEREILAAIADSQKVSGGLEAASSAGLIGSSSAIRSLFDTLVKVAPSTSSVLLEGESGTGKELVAQAIHRLSRRSSGPMVAVNCAAIPENLLESELFGHVKGAFTGATANRPGRFKLANGGTLFLDEIGEMPLLLQGKLLRVLQEREIEPVGGNKPEPVDFRLVAATNRDLEKQIAEGKFRQDLYYRLNVVPLRLPPLRERAGDVPMLARHFLQRYSQQHGAALRFSGETMAVLEQHSWPGNVRELENLVERLAVLKGQGEIGVDDLPAQVRSPRPNPPVTPSNQSLSPVPAAHVAPPPPLSFEGPPRPAAAPHATPPSAPAASLPLTQHLPPEGIDLYAVLRELEDRLIGEALERSGGNRKQAAKLLALNRTTLVEKLKKKSGPKAASAPDAGSAADPGASAADPAGSPEAGGVDPNSPAASSAPEGPGTSEGGEG